KRYRWDGHVPTGLGPRKFQSRWYCGRVGSWTPPPQGSQPVGGVVSMPIGGIVVTRLEKLPTLGQVVQGGLGQHPLSVRWMFVKAPTRAASSQAWLGSMSASFASCKRSSLTSKRAARSSAYVTGDRQSYGTRLTPGPWGTPGPPGYTQ